ncbi:hypothetical protein [EBPR podovirus 2]|jgi:hypothetical protein|nr:hypothetical protein [EBPR podovirus 2]
MTTASDLADALGRKTIADALGVLPTAVSNAVVRGWFPSSWFLAVKAIADAEGRECPPELFKMRAHNPSSVDLSAADQVSAPQSKQGAAG